MTPDTSYLKICGCYYTVVDEVLFLYMLTADLVYISAGAVCLFNFLVLCMFL